MVRSHKPPSQTWRTLRTIQMVSIDFFVPTIRLQVLKVFLVLAHEASHSSLQCDLRPASAYERTIGHERIRAK